MVLYRAVRGRRPYPDGRTRNGRWKIPISRTDLAHLLGWRPESLSRAFHALAGEGSIALKKSDLIELRDICALGAVAGVEYVVNHPTMEQLLETLNNRDD
jgi:CRP/FNR family transcriptional regulator